MLKRHINFDIAAGRTFFLWGQRQVGKSTLIRQLYPNGLYIDLLRSLATEFKNVRRKIIVCCESVKRMTDDGILILPWRDFATMLWDGELTG